MTATNALPFELFNGQTEYLKGMPLSIMIFEVYDALKEAGATEEKAKAAATALAAYENRFAKIDTDLTVINWMVGFNLALSVSVLFKLFT